MKFFSTPNEKKSAIITSLIGVLLIIIFFVFGLTFFDPPISYGVEVNFGILSDEKLITKVTFETSENPLKKTISNNSFNDSELKFGYLPKVITRMRVGGASNRSLKTIIRKTKEDYRAIKRNKIGNFTTLITKNTSKLKQFF